MSMTKLKTKFGKGYQTDAEKNNAFVLADDRVRYDHFNGAGGAVKVAGYKGIWPPFGNPRERLGGPDLLVFKDEKEVQNKGQVDTKVDQIDDGGATGAIASGSKQLNEDFSKLNGIHFIKRPEWMCRPRSGCKPCDRSELYKPFCQPYGNRILIECRKIEATKTPDRKPFDNSSPPSSPQKVPQKPSQNNGLTGADGAKGAPVIEDVLKKPDEIIAPPPPPAALNANGGLDGFGVRSLDELVQFGDVFLEPRNDIINSNSINLELVRREEMFVSGHVYKGYQICGRDRAREARDYAEFLGVNLILALIGLYILLNRQRFLAGEHRSMLARRIGRT